MPFNVFSIREVGDTDFPEMYPLISEERLLVFEESDGDETVWLRASSIAVMEVVDGKTRTLLSLGDIGADVLVTDSRVAVVSVRFDKGGGWIGSPTAMVVLNTVSIIRARMRSRGKALVGHVRMPWVRSVGFRPKRRFLETNWLRLVLDDGTTSPTRTLLVDLGFAKEVDTAAAARDICRRAARQRLAQDPEKIAEKARTVLNAFVDPPMLDAPEGNEFAMYRMPTYWPANPRTARIG